LDNNIEAYTETFSLEMCIESRQFRRIIYASYEVNIFFKVSQPPIHCIPGALSLGLKRPRREADHSPPSSAEVKNVWSYTVNSPIRLHVVVLS